MFRRGCCLLLAVLLCGGGVASAEVITIDKEPQELIDLRKTYIEERKNGVMPSEIAAAEEEYSQAKKGALKSNSYQTKKLAIEKARQKEIAAIKARYQKELKKLEQGTELAVDKQYKKKISALKKRSVQNVHASYLKKLQKIEKELIVKSDLAGALVVQTERKRMTKVDLTKPLETLAPVVSKPVSEKAAPASAAPQGWAWKTKDNQVQISTVRGVAGSSGNESNNVYTFQVAQANNAKLVFYGYGRKSNKSYGKVLLTKPSGSSEKVANWSPGNLQGPKFKAVRSYADVKPVEVDISQAVTEAGAYQVKFQYTDGDEPLNIYRVEMHTW